MQRYPGIDPPEYADWKADEELVAGFAATVAADPDRSALIGALDRPALLDLYAGLVRFRVHDLTLKRWVKRGVISKAWLGTGEEAVTVGAVHALDRGSDIVAPMIRNAGALHEMGMSLETMFHGYLGTAAGPNHGVDGHFGDLSHGVLQPISHVGVMVPVITGIAHSFALRHERRVALTWIGDGATKTGMVHEGLNLAAVMRVPAIFIVQNNQVALGTRLDQHQAGDFDAWAAAYGLAGARADGNNVLDVWAATKLAAERALSGGGATLLVADTFRMGGHATHDEAEARRTFAPELFETWGRRDPIGLYEEWLVGNGFSRADLSAVETRVTAEVESAAEAAREKRDERIPEGPVTEYSGFSAGMRQPGLASRLEAP